MIRKLAIFAASAILTTSLAWAIASAAAGPKVQRENAAVPMAQHVERQIDAILSRVTLEQKIDMIGGVDGFYIRAYPSLGLPALRMADGPMGVRNGGPATAMPGGINLAATWDPALAQEVGQQIGRDARAKGVNFLLGPGVNIYRAPMDGRNFEFFGEDPYLASQIAVGYIEGVQSEGVSATIKHFVANNSEFSRHSLDEIIDERTLREIYLPAFEAAVKQAHVGAVMDSYNLVNGEHMTQSKFLDTEVLKNEWGFQGVLMSDWFATYDGVAAANAGLDLEMPSGAFMNRTTLLPAIRDGRVSVATINEKVRRILRLAITFHWLDRPQTDLSIPRYNLRGSAVALKASIEGMVLLKNDGKLLPLDPHKIKSIAVIGPDGYPAVPVGGGSAGVRPFFAVSFLQGIAKKLGPAVSTYYDRGIPQLSELAARTDFSISASGGSPGLAGEYFSGDNLQGDPITRRVDTHINFGEVSGADLGYASPAYPAGAASARWTGYYSAPSAGAYDCFVESTGEAGGYYRVYVDNKLALDDWTEARALVGLKTLTLTSGPHKVVVEHHGMPGFLGMRFRFGIVSESDYVDPQAEKLAAEADAVVLTVGFDPQSESEGSDRTFHLPPGQDQLIEKIASINPHTIVVITSGGSVEMTDWLDHVPAVLESWYSGQEGGTALAQILFGDADPSGRLPITFETRWADNPVHDSYYPEPGSERVAYKEGVFVGYRGYERSGIKPLFPFGYGLSYTTFRLANLKVRPLGGAAESGDPRRGGLRYEVSFDVTNTGKRSGADVAEIYVGEIHPQVPRPARELKGFARVELRPGETRLISIQLNSRAFAYFDTAAHEWRVDPGEFKIFVGSSVDQLPLERMIKLTSSQAAAGDTQP
ncbi:MAG: glycoside hydrolase family 3 protein [Candidatus Acidiferrales bacterium]